MKYHVLYVEEGVPILRSFKTKAQLDKFGKTINVDPFKDSWIDLVIQGKLLYIEDGLIEKESKK